MASLQISLTTAKSMCHHWPRSQVRLYSFILPPKWVVEAAKREPPLRRAGKSSATKIISKIKLQDWCLCFPYLNKRQGLNVAQCRMYYHKLWSDSPRHHASHHASHRQARALPLPLPRKWRCTLVNAHHRKEKSKSRKTSWLPSRATLFWWTCCAAEVGALTVKWQTSRYFVWKMQTEAFEEP